MTRGTRKRETQEKAEVKRRISSNGRRKKKEALENRLKRCHQQREENYNFSHAKAQKNSNLFFYQ